MHPSKKAFTLIELLVVIAIIALLVSILLPSLNRAKGLAKKTVCMAHLKGIGLTCMMYADSNNDCLPVATIQDAAAYPTTGYVIWAQLLSAYAGEATEDSYDSSAVGQADYADLFKGCPEFEYESGSHWNPGYGMVVSVHWLNGEPPKDEWGNYENRLYLDDMAYGETITGENGEPRTYRFFKRVEFSDSARRGWMGDSMIHHIGGGPTTEAEYDPDNRLWPTWSKPRDGGYGLSSDPERHDGSSNIWFIDGHAKDYKYNVGGNAFYDIERLPW